MKATKSELAAVSAAAIPTKTSEDALAEKREAARIRKRAKEGAKNVWLQVTKIVVPAWFGQNDVIDGLRLSREFSPAALLALIAVGQAARKTSELSSGTECEVGMQIKLRPSGFDRQEARDLAQIGFSELKKLKLIKQVKKPTIDFPYAYYVLSVKGKKWYELIENSAGCAPS
jgi:hypothetical protein